MIRLEPLGEYLMIIQDSPDKRSKGGVDLPEQARELPMTGLVIAIGDGRLDNNGKKVAMEVKPNDRVIYERYRGNIIRFRGKELLFLKESEVMGIIGV